MEAPYEVFYTIDIKQFEYVWHSDYTCARFMNINKSPLSFECSITLVQLGWRNDSDYYLKPWGA